MKNKITKLLNVLMLLLSISLFSQNFEELKKTGKASEPTFVYDRPENCALNTSFLMMDLKQNKDIEYLKNRYSLNEIDNNLYVSAFLKIDKTVFNKTDVESLGVKLNTEAGNFFTALIPINSLENLFSVEGLLKVEIAEKAHSTMDNARTLTNVNQVHSGTGLPQSYTGNGVIVGVIDGGFDYTHPTFRNLNNSQLTRISKVWEQNGTTTSPAPYGTEYQGSTAILNRMRDKVDESHGTHVAGIAGGNGGTSNSIYKGIAYDSEIVLVSTNMLNTGILNGLQYIFNHATTQNKPAVVNISIGSHIGPHDGTSTFDSMSSTLAGNGKILVGSAGNEGSDLIHLGKSFTLNDNYCYSFILNGQENNLFSNGVSYIDVWGEVGKNFEVSVNIVKIVNNQVQLVSYTPYYNTNINNSSIQTSIQDSDTTNPDTSLIEISTETNSTNQKPHAELFINNSAQDDNDHLILFEIKSTNGVVNSWITAFGSNLQPTNRRVEFTNLGSTNTSYISGDTNITIGEVGGTGNSIISVGAFNSKSCTTMYFNNNNPKCSFDVATELFDIADFSSKGPTADGRIKPDITAPGNRIVSSISRFDSSYNFTGGNFNQNENYADVVSGLTDNVNNWYFAANQGTSMAAPMVTGIIALWLQANPNLTVAQIKTILQNTADTDSFTGTGSAIPNNTWGRGKIDAYGGIQYINQFLNVDTFDTTNNFIVYPNPTSSKIFITSKEYVSSYEIYNTLGQKVKEGSFNAVLDQQELDLTALQNGLYILKFKGEKVNKTVRIVKQ
jgi:subtilisin family serine protease